MDDNPVHVRVLEVVFGERGIEIAGTAGDGERGIEVVRRVNPRLVVMDLEMPGMDGIEATVHLTARWPELDVVAYTATESPEVDAGFRAAGAIAVFAKGEHYALADLVERRLGLAA